LRLIKPLDAICFPADARPRVAASQWWIGWVDKEPAAYAGLRLLPGGLAFLSRAGVLPPARGKGLQRRLIRVRLAAARRAGLETAFTYTVADNVPSMNNLIAEGFRTYEPEWAWAGRSGVIYWIRSV